MSSFLDSLSKAALSHAKHQQLRYSLFLSALSLGYGLSWMNQHLSADALNHGADAVFEWNREIILVTGGAGGIGGEIVKRLAQAGVTVVVIDVMDLTYPAGNCSTSGFAFYEDISDEYQVLVFIITNAISQI